MAKLSYMLVASSLHIQRSLETKGGFSSTSGFIQMASESSLNRLSVCDDHTLEWQYCKELYLLNPFAQRPFRGDAFLRCSMMNL